MKWMVSTFGGNQSGTWYLYIRSCHLHVMAQIGQFKSLCCWSLDGKKTASTLVSTFPSLFLSQVTFKRVFRECRHLSPCSSCPKSWQVLASCGKNTKPAILPWYPISCRSGTQVKYTAALSLSLDLVEYFSDCIITFPFNLEHFSNEIPNSISDLECPGPYYTTNSGYIVKKPGHNLKTILHNQLRICSEKDSS